MSQHLPVPARTTWSTALTLVLAALAGMAGLYVLAGVLSSLPTASSADIRPTPSAMALPTAQAYGLVTAGTSVPDAGTALAVRKDVFAEAAPPF